MRLPHNSTAPHRGTQASDPMLTYQQQMVPQQQQQQMPVLQQHPMMMARPAPGPVSIGMAVRPSDCVTRLVRDGAQGRAGGGN